MIALIYNDNLENAGNNDKSASHDNNKIQSRDRNVVICVPRERNARNR